MNVLDENILESQRQLLRKRDFSTQAKRMGAVIRVMHTGLAVWRLHAEHELRLGWRD